MKQAKDTSEEYEYYTPQEIEALDKYQDFTEHYFDDDELYDIIIKYKYDDEKIKNELSDMLRGVKRGDEYKWHEYGKKKKEEDKTTKKPYSGGYKKNFKKNINSYNKEGKEDNATKGNYRKNYGNKYYKRGGYNSYRRGGNRSQQKGVEVVEVELKEVALPESNKEIVEKVYEVKEPMPESSPDVKKEDEVQKEEGNNNMKVSQKPKHHKKEKEEKRVVPEKIVEETTVPIVVEPKKEETVKEEKKNDVTFNPVKTEQVEIVKETKKEEPKKELTFEQSHHDFQIKTEPKPTIQQSQTVPTQQVPPQYPQMPYPYPMFMPPNMQQMDPKNPNGQMVFMMVPTYLPYDPNDKTKNYPPMYVYPQPVHGDYAYSNPYMFMPPQMNPQMYQKHEN